MPSSLDYLQFVLDQLSAVEGVTVRQMMGEYLLYVHGKLVGGVYDNRLLVKPTASARSLMPDAPEETPYPGAKPMLLVEDMENRAFLSDLFRALHHDLPAPKEKQKKQKS